MTADEFYIGNSKPDHLYIRPTKDNKGAYAQLIDEEIVGIIEINRFRLSLSMFYTNDKRDFTTFKLLKLKYHKTFGWKEDGEIQISGFQLEKLGEFVSLISSLNLSDARKTRLSLDVLNAGALNAVLRTDKGKEFLKKIAENPELTQD